jgi:hypothetical protein
MTTNTVQEKTTGRPCIRLDMTARGVNDEATTKMREYFDLAHDWIVNGFADVTTPTMQEKVWRRHQ